MSPDKEEPQIDRSTDGKQPYAKDLRKRLAASREERSYRGQSQGNPNARPLTALRHVEGFKLMKYVSQDDGFVEWIWNSRDGVTPFGIGDARDGAEAMMHHADWGEDAMVPNFIPPVGSRVFMDHDEVSAAEAFERYKARFEQSGRPIPEDRHAGILAGILRDPRVAVVDDQLHQRFRDNATNTPWCPARAA